MIDFPRSLIEFPRRFADERACADYLAATRWPEGFRCPACGRDKGWELITKPFTWECAGCGRQTSLTAWTVMHGSKLALTIWFWAAYLMATHSNGISALQLLKQLGLGSYKTAWLLSAKLRRAMVAPKRNPLTGIVEVDETTIPYRTREDAVLGGSGRSAEGKMLIAGSVEVAGNAPGRVGLAAVADFSAASLHSFVKANVAAGATPRPKDGPAMPASRMSTTTPTRSARWPLISCFPGCTGSSPTSSAGPWCLPRPPPATPASLPRRVRLPLQPTSHQTRRLPISARHQHHPRPPHLHDADQTGTTGISIQMLNGKLVIGLALTLLTISGCTNFGAQQVPADQFDYNRAIARSMQDQMLLNVVRLRYFEAPVFLAVSSVLTQYAWQGSVGVGGQEGFSIGGGVQAPSFVSGAATAQYVERPTITYLPIEGDDFSRRMLTPLPLDFVFALQEAGYATDLLFRAGISRINDVQNMGVAGIPAPGDVDRELQAQMEIENLKRFQHLINLMLKLYLYNAIEVQHRAEDNGKQRFLVISPRQRPEVAALIDEFKIMLGLDPAKSIFRITDRRVGRAADEITIQTRSLFQIMGFLAQGVEIPLEEHQQVRMIGGAALAAGGSEATGIPFRVRWSKERPSDAFVAIEYNGYWFSVTNNDIESKRGFNLLVYGFRLLAPERAAAAPALTLPTGP